MSKVQSDFTSIVRDESGVSILKCKIIDDKYLIFQMYNKTKEVLTPQFKIKADFGMLKFVSPTKWQKQFEASSKLIKNIDRNSLIGYYNQFKLKALIGAY